MKKISIIGLGLIGGSLAKSLKNFDKSISIFAYDKPEILSLAENDKIIDGRITNIYESVESDIIFLCLPSEDSLEVLRKLAGKISEGTIISDVCSVKGIFNDVWNQLSSRGVYIGGHPMTGKEKGGYLNSDELLFENAIYILSDQAKDCDIKTDFINLLKRLNTRIKFMNPYLHDKAIARISHLPQLLAVSLINTSLSGNSESFLELAAGGFRDLTRIASSDFSIWKSVFKFNKNEIITSIEILHETLNSIEDLLECDNFNDLEKLFVEAKEKRNSIPLSNKGFLSPLCDLFVWVKDEPGALSKLATLLFENNINIKDIELLKIREGTAGTFRLSFSDDSSVEFAKKVLRNNGYSVK